MTAKPPKIYKKYNRDQWTKAKLEEVKDKLPNNVVSDIGSGHGYFEPMVAGMGLEWNPYDYVRKIEKVTIWDLNDPPPEGSPRPGFVIFLEVLEHLSNPELGIRNISDHILKDGYMVLSTPNPLYAKSKLNLIIKSQLYAFQPKHLEEHHVFVPLPHVVQYFLERNGFRLLEYGTLGQAAIPKLRWSFNYIKDLIKFGVEKIFTLFDNRAIGHSQVFFAQKIK
ncbi:methyltransferase domain-containing protein [Leptobacterium flavescens]|uniref:Methyltransferase domain-containing protein n=1 Tax=Leptobacterium flavescens TaxID=472055 RepID=A0A6P0UJY1_9FLAO|nr:methyltransferase domain-containing protein [Leptobacterium flavescens]NER12179.1 methyltransferase domain-containing protein [Leptobacterium flavescens]